MPSRRSPPGARPRSTGLRRRRGADRTSSTTSSSPSRPATWPSSTRQGADVPLPVRDRRRRRARHVRRRHPRVRPALRLRLRRRQGARQPGRAGRGGQRVLGVVRRDRHPSCGGVDWPQADAGLMEFTNDGPRSAGDPWQDAPRPRRADPRRQIATASAPTRHAPGRVGHHVDQRAGATGQQRLSALGEHRDHEEAGRPASPSRPGHHAEHRQRRQAPRCSGRPRRVPVGRPGRQAGPLAASTPR